MVGGDVKILKNGSEARDRVIEVRAPQELVMLFAQNDVQIAVPRSNGQFRNTWDKDPGELKRAAEVMGFYKTILDKGASGVAAVPGEGYSRPARVSPLTTIDAVARPAASRSCAPGYFPMIAFQSESAAS